MKLFSSLFRKKQSTKKQDDDDDDENFVDEWEKQEEVVDKFDPNKIVSDRYVVFADGIVPLGLQNKLKSDLQLLPYDAAQNSHILRDLINPSLYPFIKGESYTLNGAEPNEIEEDIDHWGRLVENSKYQWLPSIYSVDDKNKVKIKSYINNLNPNKHPEIYSDCEKIFEILLPHIEKCMHYARYSYKDGFHESKKSGFVPIKGPREYQVITKASNYVLEPEALFRGMTHEHILVSALYYYSSSPYLEDKGLSFRVENDDSFLRTKRFGNLPTKENRVIIFSNEFQHKVANLKNLSKTEIATRKILCFFVVDPKQPIVSTLDVPYQQWEHRMKRLVVILLWISKYIGVRLPKDIVLRIVELAKIGFTREEALKHEIELNNERDIFETAMNVQLSRNFARTTICLKLDDFN